MKAFPGALAVAVALLAAPAMRASDENVSPKEAKEAKEAKAAKPADPAKIPDGTAAQAPAGPAAPRLIVVRDPATGQLRAPTAEERRALLQSARQSLAAAVPQTYIEEFADGRRVAHLGAEHFRWSVVRRNADGTLVYECVPEGRLPQALSAPAPAPEHPEK